MRPCRMLFPYLSILLISALTLWSKESPATSPGITVYTFSGLDGANPTSGFVMDKSGVLYGTTENGGSTGDIFGCGAASVYGCGAVFSLTPPSAPGGAWTEAVLYSFTGQNGDGISPDSNLAMDQNGALYGTTFYGGITSGSPSGYGYGVVFQVAPPGLAPGGVWTETVLYRFTGGEDGAYPVGVVVGANRAVYVTASRGGLFGEQCPDQRGCGTIYELKPPQTGGSWTGKAIYRFTGHQDDGSGPDAALARASTGVLFGTTQYGGTSNSGTVFSLSPPPVAGGAWTERVLYAFTGQNGDGYSPNTPLVIGKGGALHGTAGGGAFGLGVVFSLAPPATPGADWTESVLHSFAGQLDGSGPGGLTITEDGVLFGTTIFGGLTAGDCPSGCGTVFKIVPPASGVDWIEYVLYRYQSFTHGYYPTGTVFGSGGTLYGTTSMGGNSLGTCAGYSFYSGCGTVFKLAY